MSTGEPDRGALNNTSNSRNAPAHGEASDRPIRFRRFRLFPSQRLLLDEQRPLHLSRRTIDLLVLLVRHAGRPVAGATILAEVWPDLPAEQLTIADHVAALNDCLREAVSTAPTPPAPCIETLADGSYRFTARVETGDVTTTDGVVFRGFPLQRPYPLIGSEEAIATLTLRTMDQRLITVTGPAGIGKTSIAIAVARRAAPCFADGIGFVDLAPLASADLLPSAIAQVLGVNAVKDNPLDSLVDFLGGKRVLVVLDNCEHLLGAAASAAAFLLRAVEGLHLLATSRAPLRIKGEYLHAIGPMALPPAESTLTAAEAMQYPAVRLFVERASGSVGSFALTDAETAAVVDICRRLDGIPLAIELAAARIEHLGVNGLLEQIRAHLLQVTRRTRYSLGRHQALSAALDWSYRLLSTDEQAMLHRLAAFRGRFTLEAAATVAGLPAMGRAETDALVVSLAAKSLLAIEVLDELIHYHLFETTREYAFAKLADEADHDETLRRHARHVHRRVLNAEPDWAGMTPASWRASYGLLLDEIRAALDWCFSPDGDARLGVEISADAAPIVEQFSLVAEFRGRLEKAVEVEASLVPRSPVLELRLSSLLGDFTQQSNGDPRIAIGWTRHALELAYQVGDPRHLVLPLLGNWVVAMVGGDYPTALRLGTRLCECGGKLDDPLVSFVGLRSLAQAHHFLAHHATCRSMVAAVLAHPRVKYPLSMLPGPIDVRCSMRILLARTQWMEGFPEQARQTAEESIEYALQDRNAALCQVLALGVIPVAMWSGDDEGAARHVQWLIAHCTEHQQAYWLSWGHRYAEVLDLRQGRADSLSAATGIQQDMMFTLSETYPGAETLCRVEDGLVAWCGPEAMRLHGEAVLDNEHGILATADAEATAETWFRRSMTMATEQSARSWMLRTAMSQARLRQRQDRNAEGAALLAPVLAGFTEGFDTEDLQRAKTLLTMLAP
ncbi:ATP-binding protein [Uliginosibacterium sp. H1]|uniref:ATP-binding protein n=1 Tax=Uliginosibacterium sp. H1 TaxID=3114757 RepID=UPI002E16C1AF|nr:winged helix-turn-helix domain-containing protein [Uliginosibacterium sp. H1]